jgi:Ca-activated chloride channel family protein
MVRITPFERITRAAYWLSAASGTRAPGATIETRPEDRLSFDRPLALLSLALLAALAVGYVLARRRRSRYTVLYPNVDVLRAVAPRFSARREWAVAGLVAGALALICVALAEPRVNRTTTVENATVVLVVDTSRSMLTADIAPSRLEAAKAAARAFVDRVPERLRVGIVTFAGDANVTAFPTHDHARLHDSIDAIDPFQSGGGGTAIGDALARSVELARRSFPNGLPERTAGSRPAESGVTILFLSDGRQFRGILPPEAGAALAAQAGIPVYTVALGTDRPNEQDGLFGFSQSPDRETLRRIAETTGGEFFSARSASALSSAYGDLGSRLGRTRKPTEVTYLVVAVAAAALAAALGLSRLWEPVLP